MNGRPEKMSTAFEAAIAFLLSRRETSARLCNRMGQMWARPPRPWISTNERRVYDQLH